MSAVVTAVSDGVGHVTLNRPEYMNAITVELATGLEAALRTLSSRDDVSAIVVRGAGGNFCAGGDFTEVQRLRAQGSEALTGLFVAFGDACRAAGEVDVPVVAVVEGVAMAGGFELLQAVDVVLVRADVRLSDNHVNFGQVPGGGGSQRLARLVGRPRALGHVLSGERLDGARAVEWGLALHSYPPESFEQDAAAFVARLASRDRRALVTIKRLVRDGLETTLDDGLALELDAVVGHIMSDAGGTGEFAARGTRS